MSKSGTRKQFVFNKYIIGELSGNEIITDSAGRAVAAAGWKYDTVNQNVTILVDEPANKFTIKFDDGVRWSCNIFRKDDTPWGDQQVKGDGKEFTVTSKLGYEAINQINNLKYQLDFWKLIESASGEHYCHVTLSEQKPADSNNHTWHFMRNFMFDYKEGDCF